MTHLDRLDLSHAVVVRSQSRRTILKACGAFGVALSGMGQWSLDALAAPLVRVTPPKIVRDADCDATVSVVVTLTRLAPGVRYEVSGDLMESDDPDDDPDGCGALTPHVTPDNHQGRQVVELTAQLRAADLGLVKGIGPARDEAFSPDLVELFARIWLRDLTTGMAHGPWDSPMRIAVSRAVLDWTRRGGFPGSTLLVPRGGMPAAPPQACVS